MRVRTEQAHEAEYSQYNYEAKHPGRTGDRKSLVDSQRVCTKLRFRCPNRSLYARASVGGEAIALQKC